MNSTDDSDPSEQKLPSSREIEMVVLGAMLIEPKTIGPLAMVRLTDKHFDYAAHQIIFREMTACLRERGFLDFITLTQILDGKDLLEEVGGTVYLSDLVSSVPLIEKYIDKLVDKGKPRPM